MAPHGGKSAGEGSPEISESQVRKGESLDKIEEQMLAERELAQKGEAQQLATKILHHKSFDNSMGGIIVFNIFVMIVETDRAADEASGDGFHWTDAVGWLILMIFVWELALRMFVYRSSFWHDPFNVFDFGVVAIDSLLSFLGLMLGSFFPVSILRVCRLAKLARVSKVLRVFPELRIMMAGLAGSVSALFWGSMLLLIFLTVWSIVAVQFVHPYNKAMDYGDCERCNDAYSSVMASMLTISQTTVLGWSDLSNSVALIEAHPITAVFFTAVFLSLSLGILNLILGVVCNVFANAHDRIVAEMEDEKVLMKMESKNHLLDVCREMDTDGSGELTKEELTAGFESQEDFRETLASMDIAQEDLEILWSILDSDRSGKISHSEFVSQVYTMTSSDTQFMLAYIRYYVTMIRHDIVDSIKHAEKAELEEMNKLDEELKIMEREEEKVLEMVSTDKVLHRQGSQSLEAVGDDVQATLEKKNGSADKMTASMHPASPSVQNTDVEIGSKCMNEAEDPEKLCSRWSANLDKSALLQTQLRDIVEALRFSLDQQIATISTLVQETGSSHKYDLLAVPASNVSVVPKEVPDRTHRCSTLGCWKPDDRKDRRAQPEIPSSRSDLPPDLPPLAKA